MKIISTNIAKPAFVTINGKQQRTGIFKTPTNQPIYLGKEEVKGDEISNRRVHGGEFKACYLFSESNYPYWKNLYPNLNWTYGMFGENLTVEGLDETKIYVGDIYKLGNALIQVTQPREPCTTFAAKMGSEAIMEQFIAHAKPGTYVRVLQEGEVNAGDTLKLIKRTENSITISQLFKLIYHKDKNVEHLKLVIDNDVIPLKKRKQLKAYLNL